MPIELDESYPDAIRVTGHPLIASVRPFVTHGPASKTPDQSFPAAEIHCVGMHGDRAYNQSVEDTIANILQASGIEFERHELGSATKEFQRDHFNLRNREELPRALQMLGCDERSVAVVEERIKKSPEEIAAMHMTNKEENAHVSASPSSKVATWDSFNNGLRRGVIANR